MAENPSADRCLSLQLAALFFLQLASSVSAKPAPALEAAAQANQVTSAADWLNQASQICMMMICDQLAAKSGDSQCQITFEKPNQLKSKTTAMTADGSAG
jgi:hypothetical protein